jgi:hypothetical protein
VRSPSGSDDSHASGKHDRRPVSPSASTFEGELAAILQDGAVRWAANDMTGMLGLYERVLELADQGSRGAFELAAIGRGAVAHMAADSTTVLAVLDGVGSAVTPEWLPTIHWFRSVAHRRNGDLQRADDELTVAELLVGTDPDMVQQLRLARLRTNWLAGRVDEVRAELPAIHEHFAATGNRFLATEAAIELAAKAAIVGELDTGRELLAAVEPMLPDMPGQLARILHGIASAAVAVGEGAEDHATDVLRDHGSRSPATTFSRSTPGSSTTCSTERTKRKQPATPA